MLAHGTIGKSIKALRQQRAMTQSQLADTVGVTTQAVSKWECGGTPDAELLPDIAAALGVSIDTLFGLSNEVKQDPVKALAYELSLLPEEERLYRAIQLSLAGLIATAGNESVNDLIPLVTGVKTWRGKDHLMRMYEKDGFAVGNLTDQKQYVFTVYNPRGAYDEYLAPREHYRRLFALLGQENALNILLFLLHKRSETAVLTGVIAKGVGLREAETERWLNQLAELNLALRRDVEGERGALTAWSLTGELHLLAVLILLRDVADAQLLMLNLDLLGPDHTPLLQK